MEKNIFSERIDDLHNKYESKHYSYIDFVRDVQCLIPFVYVKIYDASDALIYQKIPELDFSALKCLYGAKPVDEILRTLLECQKNIYYEDPDNGLMHIIFFFTQNESVINLFRSFNESY